MKTRLGFVSNSSSSSYVVALRPTSEPCAHCGRTDPNFLDIVEAIGSRSGNDYECTQLHERGLEQLSRYVEKEINEDKWAEDAQKETWKKILALATKAVAKGYTVARFEMSYHDEATNGMFKDLEDRKAVIILWSDHRDVNLSKIKL